MDEAAHWNAIYTRPNHEKRVCGLLEKKGIFYCYFENTIAVDNFGQMKTVTSPLFPSMIFVLLRAPQSLSSLLSLPDVKNITYWKNQPAAFPTTEIDLLRNFMQAHKTVELTKTGLQVNNKVSVLESYPNYNSKDIYILNLPSIGYSLSAKAEPVTSVKLVRNTPARYRTADGLAYMLGFKSASDRFE